MRLPYLRRARVARVGITLMLALLAWGRAIGQQATIDVDEAFVREAVESVAAIVDREYFDADLAGRAALSLRDGLAHGRYGGVDTLETLASRLPRDLFATTRDRHLTVAVVEDRSSTPTSTVPDDDAREARARRTNFGVQRVEVLAGNVGYLNLTSFFRLEEARDAIAAAMRLLRSVDALILDMRENGGGSPETVALLASYFFDAPGLPLFEIVPRAGSGNRYTTSEPGVAERNGTRPAYVLTSKRTFSAGEGFAYILQERRRIEVIGEPTAGAANPGRPYPVSPRLQVTVPNGQVRTAVTGRNWEGDGVHPT